MAPAILRCYHNATNSTPLLSEIVAWNVAGIHVDTRDGAAVRTASETAVAHVETRLDEKMSKVVAAITATNRLFAILSDTHMTQREIDDLQIHLRNTHGYDCAGTPALPSGQCGVLLVWHMDKVEVEGVATRLHGRIITARPRIIADRISFTVVARGHAAQHGSEHSAQPLPDPPTRGCPRRSFDPAPYVRRSRRPGDLRPAAHQGLRSNVSLLLARVC